MTAFLRSTVSSPLNALLTLALLGGAALALPGLVKWGIVGAVWHGEGPDTCRGVEAACWLFIRLRWDQILFGGYPAAEQWRVVLAAGLGLVGVAALLLPRVPHKAEAALALLLLYPPVAAVLLYGGVFGLAAISTRAWGGLMLTVVVAAWTIVTSIPLGLLLALGRRSRLPVVAKVAALYIDVTRGLPLIGVLYLAIVLFPLFMPPGLEVDTLMRALVAFTLFNAATLAEVFRGGLQSVPAHQAEAGAALGFSHGQRLLLIVLPQAITAALPGIVNVAVEIVKETTLILIIGLFDLLGVLQAGTSDPQWLVGDQIRPTAYVFGGIMFWALCFSLSRYSASIERSLSKGRRR